MESSQKHSTDSQSHLPDLSDLISTINIQFRIVQQQQHALRAQLSQYENEWVEHALRISSLAVGQQQTSSTPTPEVIAGRRRRFDPALFRGWNRDTDESASTEALFYRLMIASQSLGSSMTMLSSRHGLVSYTRLPPVEEQQPCQDADVASGMDDLSQLMRRRRLLQEAMRDFTPPVITNGRLANKNYVTPGIVSGLIGGASAASPSTGSASQQSRCPQCQGNLQVAVEETGKWLSSIERALSHAARIQTVQEPSTVDSRQARPTEQRNDYFGHGFGLPPMDEVQPRLGNVEYNSPQECIQDLNSPPSGASKTTRTLSQVTRRKPLPEQDTVSLSESSQMTTSIQSTADSAISSPSGVSTESQSDVNIRQCPICGDQAHPTSDTCQGADKEAVTPKLEQPFSENPSMASLNTLSESSISLPQPSGPAAHSTFNLILGSDRRLSPSLSDRGTGGAVPEVQRKSRGREALERRMGIESRSFGGEHSL